MKKTILMTLMVLAAVTVKAQSVDELFTQQTLNYLKSVPFSINRSTLYTAEELYDIFILMADEANLWVDKAGCKYLEEYFDRLVENKPANFANGRAVRNLFEEVLTAQANRLAPQKEITDEELNTLTFEDFLVDENED